MRAFKARSLLLQVSWTTYHHTSDGLHIGCGISFALSFLFFFHVCRLGWIRRSCDARKVLRPFKNTLVRAVGIIPALRRSRHPCIRLRASCPLMEKIDCGRWHLHCQEVKILSANFFPCFYSSQLRCCICLTSLQCWRSWPFRGWYMYKSFLV